MEWRLGLRENDKEVLSSRLLLTPLIYTVLLFNFRGLKQIAQVQS